MICLDSNAAIAAFQMNPPANIAVHRDRVRAFLTKHFQLRLMMPSIALAEYLWKANRSEFDKEIQKVLGKAIFTPPFTDSTAEIAANIGRSYTASRGMGDIARESGTNRVALKADLMIVAVALEHSAQHFITGDSGCHTVATFAA